MAKQIETTEFRNGWRKLGRNDIADAMDARQSIIDAETGTKPGSADPALRAKRALGVLQLAMAGRFL
jgi:hypothetical protein